MAPAFPFIQDQLHHVDYRPGEAIQLVDHDAVHLAGGNKGPEPGQRRAFQRAAGDALVDEDEALRRLPPLAPDISVAGLALNRQSRSFPLVFRGPSNVDGHSIGPNGADSCRHSHHPAPFYNNFQNRSAKHACAVGELSRKGTLPACPCHSVVYWHV
jgi:hypothetical protein